MSAWDHSRLMATPYRNSEGLQVFIASGETGAGRKFWYETSAPKTIGGSTYRMDVYDVKWFDFPEARRALDAKYQGQLMKTIYGTLWGTDKRIPLRLDDDQFEDVEKAVLKPIVTEPGFARRFKVRPKSCGLPKCLCEVWLIPVPPKFPPDAKGRRSVRLRGHAGITTAFEDEFPDPHFKHKDLDSYYEDRRLFSDGKVKRGWLVAASGHVIKEF